MTLALGLGVTVTDGLGVTLALGLTEGEGLIVGVGDVQAPINRMLSM